MYESTFNFSSKIHSYFGKSDFTFLNISNRFTHKVATTKRSWFVNKNEINYFQHICKSIFNPKHTET